MTEDAVRERGGALRKTLGAKKRVMAGRNAKMRVHWSGGAGMWELTATKKTEGGMGLEEVTKTRNGRHGISRWGGKRGIVVLHDMAGKAVVSRGGEKERKSSLVQLQKKKKKGMKCEGFTELKGA